MSSCILPHQSVHRPEQTHHHWPPVSYLINQYTDQSRLVINDLLYLTSSISNTDQSRLIINDLLYLTSSIDQTVHRPEQTHHQLPHQSVHRPEQTHHQWPPVSYLINQYTDPSRLIINDLLYLTSSISTQTRADSSSMTSCILPHQSVQRPEQTHHQWPPVSYLINQYIDKSRIIINDLLYLTSSISTLTRADSSSMTSCILPH